MSEKKPLDEAKTSRVLADVLEERRRQHEKWGEQNLPDAHDSDHNYIVSSPRIRRDAKIAAEVGTLTWALVLIEEAREAIDEASGDDPFRTSLDLRAELVQVAAVAVQWIEALDRRTAKTEGSEP